MKSGLSRRNPSRLNKIGWDIMLFFALYIIAPDYCAFEFHRSIPLITISRGLLVLMGFMLLFRRREDLFNLRKPDWKGMNFGLTEDKFLRACLLIFFALLTMCNLALFPSDKGESLKALFSLALECYALMWILTTVLNTREKLLCCLRILAITAGVTGVIAIVGCIIDYNPFHLLKTTQRDMLMTTYYRLGVLRAEAGFGHPVFYGAFCAVMVPVQVYFYENENKKTDKFLYGAAMTMTLLGLILSNSRGSLLAIGCTIVLLAVLRIISKSFKKFLLQYIPILMAVIILLAGIVSVVPNGKTFIPGIANSLISIVAPEHTIPISSNTASDTLITEPDNPTTEPDNPTTEPDNPTTDPDNPTTDPDNPTTDPDNPTTEPDNPTTEAPPPSYGENEDGLRSRLIQLTGITWTLRQKPIFGLGSNAHMKGLVSYQFQEGQWWTKATFDMALVSIVCQYGLVGLLGYIALYGSMLKTWLDKKYRKDKLMQALGIAFLTYMLCLLSISSLDRTGWTVMSVIVCLANIIRKEQFSTGKKTDEI